MDTQTLKPNFKGKLISPTDREYEDARKVFYGGIDKKPSLIIKVANANDVYEAVKLAKSEGLELAIRSGGHSYAGYSSTEGGILVDLRDMRGMDFDLENKTVWAETGLTAKDLTEACDKHDLAIGFGDTGSVGIGGITLGGGIGFLVRKFGMAIDNLLAAEIVTADGEILQIDSENHPDLFWAIRGGGGNFGVVTKFKYQLHELKEVLGGMLLLPASEDVITRLMNIVDEAPDELSAIINIMPTFPMPNVDKEFVGKVSVMVLMVYAGDPKVGEKVIAPIRALATPIADMIKPMRYKDIFFPEDDSYHPKAVSKTLFTKNIDSSLVKTIIDQLNLLEAPMKAVQLRVLGGAMERVSPDATAYAHRSDKIMANVAAFYETDQEKTVRQTWVDNLAKELQDENTGAYVGFLGVKEENRLQEVYPTKTLERLSKVKKQYDPNNFFKLNFNIEPK